MSEQDIRWKQRFGNFQKAYGRLKETLEAKKLNELERNGLALRFEFTIELCWKILKDYLQDTGFKFTPSPKETIRQAYSAGIIEDGQILIDAIELRNELSHDYSGEKFEKSESQIRGQIFSAIQKVYLFFSSKN
jgi:nucleotidyltransferase substrate binding protein (TIGR01987 family)